MNDETDLSAGSATRDTSAARFYTTSDLASMGLPRRAIDAVLRAVPTVHLDGYTRPLVRASDFDDYIAAHTFDDDRVRAA